jgi:hypothetical protein
MKLTAVFLGIAMSATTLGCFAQCSNPAQGRCDAPVPVDSMGNPVFTTLEVVFPNPDNRDFDIFWTLDSAQGAHFKKGSDGVFVKKGWAPIKHRGLRDCGTGESANRCQTYWMHIRNEAIFCAEYKIVLRTPSGRHVVDPMIANSFVQFEGAKGKRTRYGASPRVTHTPGKCD